MEKIYDELMMREIVDSVSQIRGECLSYAKSEKEVSILLSRLRACKALKGEPLVKKLILDLEQFLIKKTRFSQTKQHIISQSDNFVISLFDAPYFKSLNLDCFFYEELSVSAYMRNRYPSPVLPVNLLEFTEGFRSPVVVALFPENHMDQIQVPEDKIFYFIDKFVSRYDIKTKKLLHVVDPNALQSLRNASKEDIVRANVIWVWLHEYHHRQGFMPIPEYLHIKSNRALAGLEELRVDLLSLFAIRRDPFFSKQDTLLFCEYILAERILRYSIEGIPNPNYDAIASQALFNFLLKEKAIFLQGMTLFFTNSLYAALMKFLDEINKIEQEIFSKSESQVKSNLLGFVRSLTAYDGGSGLYSHLDYFGKVKEAMSL